MVSARYATANNPTGMETRIATVLWIVKKNMTRPAKNKDTEM
jgi:hypothetical protein